VRGGAAQAWREMPS